MKNNFYISVSLGLLEPKHQAAMKESVWLYLWFLNKVTQITNDGLGKVLGGKPLKFEDISSDLGITLRTYRRYIAMLKSHGYITVNRTPYGLVICISKAKKLFGFKVSKNGTSQEESDVPKTVIEEPKMAHQPTKNGTSNIRQESKQDNKTTSTDVAIEIAEEGVSGKEFNALLDEFKHVNPMHHKLFAIKAERKALQELIDKYGIERMKNLLSMLPNIVSKPYAPRITTPYQLQKKIGEVIIFLNQEKGKEANDKHRGIDATLVT